MSCIYILVIGFACVLYFLHFLIFQVPVKANVLLFTGTFPLFPMPTNSQIATPLYSLYLLLISFNFYHEMHLYTNFPFDSTSNMLTSDPVQRCGISFLCLQNILNLESTQSVLVYIIGSPKRKFLDWKLLLFRDTPVVINHPPVHLNQVYFLLSH